MATSVPLAGTAYSATMTAPKVWVLASLFDAARVTFEDLVEVLTDSERERLWQDFRTIGIAMGLKPTDMPATWPAFDAWFSGMIAGNSIETGPTFQDICAHLFDLGSIFLKIDDLCALATLEARFLQALGYNWTLWRRLQWFVLRTQTRLFVRYAPDRYRFSNVYRTALARLAASGC
jgi:uncharacterized protein (DUF2236 family)